jgi:hypothetical protein
VIPFAKDDGLLTPGHLRATLRLGVRGGVEVWRIQAMAAGHWLNPSGSAVPKPAPPSLVDLSWNNHFRCPIMDPRPVTRLRCSI